MGAETLRAGRLQSELFNTSAMLLPQLFALFSVNYGVGAGAQGSQARFC